MGAISGGRGVESRKKVPKVKNGSRVVLLCAVMIIFCGGAHPGTSEEKRRMGQFFYHRRFWLQIGDVITPRARARARARNVRPSAVGRGHPEPVHPAPPPTI